MDDEDKQCICCGKEVSVLIQVTRTDEKGDLFLRNRGVCRNCLINGDVEKVTKEFEIKKCQEQIDRTKEALEFWTDNLNKLKSSKYENKM
ncbi:MAG: hypothetical protein IMZ60_03845 [Actinobacteria bacterium]|nr:hypothetical protein [Actinomycetota bacterium]